LDSRWTFKVKLHPKCSKDLSPWGPGLETELRPINLRLVFGAWGLESRHQAENHRTKKQPHGRPGPFARYRGNLRDRQRQEQTTKGSGGRWGVGRLASEEAVKSKLQGPGR
jgi:hypothetical protein